MRLSLFQIARSGVWQCWLVASLAGLFSSFAYADVKPAWSDAEVSAANVPLQVINHNHFCQRLRAAFAIYGRSQGYSDVETAMLASGATSGLIDEFRKGRTSDYINASALALYAHAPKKAAAVAGYLPVAVFLKEAMGVEQQLTLALSASELRFIPFAQKDSAMLVITNNAASLTPERSKKVAEIAKQLNITIHVVWTGMNDPLVSTHNELQTLARLVSLTNGSFIDLGGQDNPCSAVM